MAGKIDIYNLALMRLGTLPVLSPDETSKRGLALTGIYELARDMVLRDHPWNFAMRRGVLTQVSEAPEFGYAYAYQLPVGCLRVWGLLNPDTGVMDPTLSFKIEQGLLLTDESSASIRYVERVEAEGNFDLQFCSALASRLAAETAIYITGSPAVKKQMLDQYQFELMMARSADAQESPPEVFETNDWIDARL